MPPRIGSAAAARACLIGLLLSALGGCHAGAVSLPLQRGFYVADDVPCGEASNATLARLHRDGLNSAHEECVFVEGESLGRNVYRITEQCVEVGSGNLSRHAAQWELTSADGFRRTLDSGWTVQMRRCDQQALPDGWRDIDLDEAGPP
jgi:hypothetical protein